MMESATLSLEQTKHRRTSARGVFTRSLKAYTKALGSSKDLQFVCDKFSDLKQTWAIVQERHETYVAFLENPDEEVILANDTWIELLQDQFDDAEGRWYDFSKEIKVQETNRKAQEKQQREMNEAQHQRERNIEYLQKMRSLEERTFSNQADDITRMIEKEKEADSGEVTSIQEALGDLKAQLEKCRITNKDLISALDKERADKELDFLQRVQKRYGDLMCENSGKLQNSVNDKVASNRLLRSRSDMGYVWNE